MSLTLMATRSIPTVSWRFHSKARRSLVPTPSVPDTRTGSRYFLGTSNKAPNPPMPAITPSRMVLAARGLIRSTSASPASISTPASRYVKEDLDEFVMRKRPKYVKCQLIEQQGPYFTMNEYILRRKQTLLWSGVGLVLLVLLYVLSPVLTPFMLGMALAYILVPGVNMLVALKLPRWLAVGIMFFLLFAVILGVLLIVIPLVRKEVGLAIEQLPGWVAQYNINLAPRLNHLFGVSAEIDILK